MIRVILGFMLTGLLACPTPVRAAVWYDATGISLQAYGNYYLNSAGVAVPVGPAAPFPVTTAGSGITGQGSLSVTTSSALINTMTVNANSGALPSALSLLTVRNFGVNDAAICPNMVNGGATCTCSGNGSTAGTIATTNGVRLQAGGGGYGFNFGGRSSAAPTIVSCSGTVTVEFQW